LVFNQNRFHISKQIKTLNLNQTKILLITPPLTQLNTPYPATAYLKGFLKQQNYHVCQADLGIELVLELFSAKGLNIFERIDKAVVQLILQQTVTN